MALVVKRRFNNFNMILKYIIFYKGGELILCLLRNRKIHFRTLHDHVVGKTGTLCFIKTEVKQNFTRIK